MKKTCPSCNSDFICSHSDKVYCSAACKKRAKNNRRRKLTRLNVEFVCVKCGKSFWRSRDKGHRYKFCSKQCHSKSPGFQTLLYFILSPKAERVKIGISDDLPVRFADLAAANGDDLQLLGSITGGRDLELAIHEELREYRAHHEWFDFRPQEVKLLIDRYLYPDAVYESEGTLEGAPAPGGVEVPKDAFE